MLVWPTCAGTLAQRHNSPAATNHQENSDEQHNDNIQYAPVCNTIHTQIFYHSHNNEHWFLYYIGFTGNSGILQGLSWPYSNLHFQLFCVVHSHKFSSVFGWSSCYFHQYPHHPHTSSKYPNSLLCNSTLTAVRVTTAKVLYDEVLHPECFTEALPSDLVADTMTCLT